jgi:aminoglycoside phosphotransferase (APT) family kinase protein
MALDGQIDVRQAAELWDAALGSEWLGPPVWIHGDVAEGNLLVADGRFCAVIDFGQLAVGDPACDLVMAWTLFEGASREAFRAALPLDEPTWDRARGWALWKALIVMSRRPGANPYETQRSQRVLRALGVAG